MHGKMLKGRGMDGGERELAKVNSARLEERWATEGARRFTRLTNAFSTKVENHAAAVALHLMHYNFCRIHQTLRVTPAMETGIADHVWSIEEVVSLLDQERATLVA
jgi:hypothetical protein